jgi:hypothetical protein
MAAAPSCTHPMMLGRGAARLIMQRALLGAVDAAGAEPHHSPVDPSLIVVCQSAGAEQVSPDHALQAEDIRRSRNSTPG